MQHDHIHLFRKQLADTHRELSPRILMARSCPSAKLEDVLDTASGCIVLRVVAEPRSGTFATALVILLNRRQS